MRFFFYIYRKLYFFFSRSRFRFLQKDAAVDAGVLLALVPLLATMFAYMRYKENRGFAYSEIKNTVYTIDLIGLCLYAILYFSLTNKFSIDTIVKMKFEEWYYKGWKGNVLLAAYLTMPLWVWTIVRYFF